MTAPSGILRLARAIGQASGLLVTAFAVLGQLVRRGPTATE